MSVTSSRSRTDWRVAAALALGLALLYAVSAPHGVALEDDGFFLLAAHFLGIAHPPGYPLWVLLAHPWSLLPLGPEAWRLHFLSGIYGALACVALWRAMRLLGLPAAAAALAAACYGVSRVFWSQAIIAEVYTLNALVVFTLLVMILRWRAAPTARSAFALGLVYGLGLSAHWPLLGLETPALLLFAAPAWRAALRQLAVALAGVALGLAPYAWMVWRSQQDPVISFYGPMETWRDFWFMVSRAGYAGVDVSDTANWHDRLQFYGFALRELLAQFGPPGASLMALGLALRARFGWHARNTDELAILFGVLGPTLVLLTLLGFDYDPVHCAVFKVYPLTAYGFAAIWLAYGVEAARARLAERKLRVATIAAATLLLAAPLALGARENLRGGYDFGERYGRALLAVPEPNAIVFVHADPIDGPTAWLHLAEGVRPDLTLIETWGFLLDTRLFRLDRDSMAERERRLREFVEHSERPVYYASAVPHRWATESFGLMRRVDRRGSAGTERMAYSKPAFEFYDWLLRQPRSSDGATASHADILLGSMGAWLLRFDEHDLLPRFRPWREQAIAAARTVLPGTLAEAEVLLALHGRDAAPEVLEMMDRAESLLWQAGSKQDYAQVDLQRADAYRALGDEASAIAADRRAWAAWPSVANPAASTLAPMPAPAPAPAPKQ